MCVFLFVVVVEFVVCFFDLGRLIVSRSMLLMQGWFVEFVVVYLRFRPIRGACC